MEYVILLMALTILRPFCHALKVGLSISAQVSIMFNALEARELVKISVLDNNMLGAREAAEMLASRTGAEVVQVIGNKFVLYKAAKKPVIELPPAKK